MSFSEGQVTYTNSKFVPINRLSTRSARSTTAEMYHQPLMLVQLVEISVD